MLKRRNRKRQQQEPLIDWDAIRRFALAGGTLLAITASVIKTVSCGSVFRNPLDDHAARLIEASGMKGLRLGGAEVSGKHANFIINTGDATADDVERLINKIRNQVREEQGVELVAEVRIVGESLEN